MSITYTTALISFIDILGFKSLIETETPDAILEILRTNELLGLARLSVAAGGLLGGEVTTFKFSDLIVNIHELKGGYELDGNLVYLAHNHLRTIGFVQWRLACEGIFVRGGVTLGQIYADERTLFGPALVKAYELESQRAKWPIIAIDEECLEELDRQSDIHFEYRRRIEPNYPFPRNMLRHQLYGQFIARTDEGVPFLDYLACMLYEDETTGDFDFHLADHKKAVLAAYAKYRHYKYDFVARYHNQVCGRLRLSDEQISLEP